MDQPHPKSPFRLFDQYGTGTDNGLAFPVPLLEPAHNLLSNQDKKAILTI